jgi:predicted phage terminase large subunit-like protein
VSSQQGAPNGRTALPSLPRAIWLGDSLEILISKVEGKARGFRNFLLCGNLQSNASPNSLQITKNSLAKLGHRHDDQHGVAGFSGGVARDADHYLLDVFRARLQYPELRRQIAGLATRHGAETILIEKAGSGMALLQDLHRDPPPGMARPIGQKPEGSKTDRMVAQSAKIEAGHVHLPREADWLDGFLLELLGFPHGRHDDQVDSVSQYLKWAAANKFFEQQELSIGLPIVR